MVSCVSGPAIEASRHSPPQPVWPGMAQSEWTAFNPTRPLSPIFSPPQSTTPTTAIPMDGPMELPPKVPPKSPQLESGGSPRLKGSSGLSPTNKSLANSPSKQSLRPAQASAEQQTGRPQTPPKHSPRTSPTRRQATASLTTKGVTASPTSKAAEGSPTQKAVESSLKPAALIVEIPVLERGRPVARSGSKKDNAVHGDASDYAKLPNGLRPKEAAIMLPESEKETLRKQANTQAERFEILGARHVATLSKVRYPVRCGSSLY
jgi:hypothetical protein